MFGAPLSTFRGGGAASLDHRALPGRTSATAWLQSCPRWVRRSWLWPQLVEGARRPLRSTLVFVGVVIAALWLATSAAIAAIHWLEGFAASQQRQSRPLPRQWTRNSDAGYLPSVAASRGVAYWASAPLGDVGTARAVCWASKELGCMSSSWGGLGRAFWEQAMLLASRGANVTLIHVHPATTRPWQDLADTDASDAIRRGTQGWYALEPLDPGFRVELRGSCGPLDRLLDAGASVRAVELQSTHAQRRGMRGSFEAAALLDFVTHNPDACQVLHVPDWHGLGALVAQARRAGLPALQHTWVNVQAHGTDRAITGEYMIVEPRKSLNDVAYNALERIALHSADSVMFLAQAQLDVYTADGLVTSDPQPEAWIAPNFILDDEGDAASGGDDNHSHGSCRLPPVRMQGISRVVFYGKLNFRKGAHLFAAGLAAVNPDALASIQQVILIGPRASDDEALQAQVLDPIRAVLPSGATLRVEDSLDTQGVFDLFARIHDSSLVILPSIIEFQPFALVDAARAGMCVLASDIWSHRALLADVAPNQLFEPTPPGLAQSIYKAIRNPAAVCANLCTAIPRDGQQIVLDWHAQRGIRLDQTSLLSRHQRPRIHRPSTLLQQQQQQQESGHALPTPTPFLTESARAGISSCDTSSPAQAVSVVVVVCDRAHFLAQALASVAQQDVSAGLLRATIVAACPARLSCSKALEAAKPASFLQAQCLELQEHVGSLSAARNLGAAQSGIDLNLFLDDDDLLLPDAVRTLERAARCLPKAAVLASWLATFEHASGAPIPEPLHGVQWLTVGPAMELAPFANALGASNMLVRTKSSFWHATGGFRSVAWAGCEDYELLARAAWDGSLALVPQQTLWYRKVLSAASPASSMLSWNSVPELRARCSLRVLQSLSSDSKRADLFPMLHYAASLYAAFEDERWP